ncbi:MAG TPA: nucleotidyl transferase AbiEii/AbiGii toxin family protein [Thermoanaerobaculia bacterium]
MDFGKVMGLLQAMNAEGVDYIVFGAVALNLHGILRTTTDADFFIRPDRENVERLKRALRRIWDDPHIDEISADDLLGDYPSVMYGPPDESFSMDFLTRLGEVYSYETLPSEIIEYDGMPIRVVTAAKLYDMKMHTVRLQDKADAMALNEKFKFEES